MFIPLEYRKSGINVTDLSSQLWCEKQLEFSLYLGRTRTKEMVQGEQVHEQLHQEVVDLVEVKPRNFKDFLALKLINMRESAEILSEQRIIREIPVMGNINKLLIKGIVDELTINNGRTMILDTKTRKSFSLPSQSQILAGEFQLMTYKYLLDNLINGRFNYINFMRHYGIKFDDEITVEFSEELGTNESKIMKLAKTTFKTMKKMPETSDTLTLRYRKGDRFVKEHVFSFDEKKFLETYYFFEDYWLRKRKALRTKDIWKCNYCEFKKRCYDEKSGSC